jgi:hypothetical protein
MTRSDPGPTGREIPLWYDWERPLNAPVIPMLHLDGFDRPMDMLLDLAERQRIDFCARCRYWHWPRSS